LKPFQLTLLCLLHLRDCFKISCIIAFVVGVVLSPSGVSQPAMDCSSSIAIPNLNIWNRALTQAEIIQLEAAMRQSPSTGSMILNTSINKGHCGLVELALIAGTDPEAHQVNKPNERPLFVAVSHGSRPILRLLMSALAQKYRDDSSALWHSIHGHRHTQTHDTALMIAIKKNQRSQAEVLIHEMREWNLYPPDVLFEIFEMQNAQKDNILILSVKRKCYNLSIALIQLMMNLDLPERTHQVIHMTNNRGCSFYDYATQSSSITCQVHFDQLLKTLKQKLLVPKHLSLIHDSITSSSPDIAFFFIAIQIDNVDLLNRFLPAHMGLAEITKALNLARTCRSHQVFTTLYHLLENLIYANRLDPQPSTTPTFHPEWTFIDEKPYPRDTASQNHLDHMPTDNPDAQWIFVNETENNLQSDTTTSPFFTNRMSPL